MLIRPALMMWDDRVVTDHGRSPLSVSIEAIERKTRMADGTMRKYVVARKRSWSCSWELLPDSNEVVFGMDTVDGGMAAGDIEYFYNATTGAFTLKLFNGRGDIEEHLVMVSDFSKEIAKRGTVDLWNISITMEEV